MKSGNINALAKLRCVGLYMLLIVGNRSVLAHEYWIQPVGDQWQPGDVLEAEIRNGHDFTGTSLPFDADALKRAGLISPTERRALTGTLGTYPAMKLTADDPGLHLLLLETTRRKHTYNTLDAFGEFLEYHSLTQFKQRHVERGLPDQAIHEHYYRFCKALLMVDNPEERAGSAMPSDDTTSSPALLPQDQQLELVLKDNPIGTDLVKAQVRFAGAPLPNRQIELFHRNGGQTTIERRTAVSNEQGFAEFDISSPGDYMLNSVWMVESPDEQAHWVSLWASLFFQQQSEVLSVAD